jgi:hypothetical protein
MSTVRATEVSDLQILQKRTDDGFQMICMTRGIIQPGRRSRFRFAANYVDAQCGHFAYFISSSLGRDSETTLQKAYIHQTFFSCSVIQFHLP